MATLRQHQNRHNLRNRVVIDEALKARTQTRKQPIVRPNQPTPDEAETRRLVGEYRSNGARVHRVEFDPEAYWLSWLFNYPAFGTEHGIITWHIDLFKAQAAIPFGEWEDMPDPPTPEGAPDHSPLYALPVKYGQMPQFRFGHYHGEDGADSEFS